VRRAIPIVAIAGVSLVVGFGSAGAAPVQWSGNGHFYEAIHVPDKLDWRAAYDSCQAQGGYLATLNSAEEHAFVYSLVSNRPELWFIDVANNGLGPWLGGFQPPGSSEPGGSWRWVSDEAWSYTAWSPGEPNNTGTGEDRLCFFKLSGLIGDRWNDLAGTEKVKGYVIEIPALATECMTSALNGHTYKLVRTPGRISWSAAQAAAQAMGGHLATITSAAENAEVAALATDPTLWCIDPAGNGQGPWIGGYQPAGSGEPNGGWSWVTGEPFSYTAWASFEPNNLNGVEHHLQLFARGSLIGSEWNDMSDFTPYGGLGYIVEYDGGGSCANVGVEDAPLPASLLRASPNPSRAGTSFTLSITSAAQVHIRVYDVSGRSVRTLETGGRFEAGTRVVAWDGRDERGSPVPNGVYRIVVEADGRRQATSVVIMR
jgi:hypothetical protein